MAKIDRNAPSSIPVPSVDPHTSLDAAADPHVNTTQENSKLTQPATKDELDHASQLAADAKGILDSGARFVRDTLNGVVDSLAHGCPACPHPAVSPQSTANPRQNAPDTLINAQPAPKKSGQNE